MLRYLYGRHSPRVWDSTGSSYEDDAHLSAFSVMSSVSHKATRGVFLEVREKPSQLRSAHDSATCASAEHGAKKKNVATFVLNGVETLTITFRLVRLAL